MFNDSLPGSFITLQSSKKTLGYYSSKRFKNKSIKISLDEIALNPNFFFYGENEVLQTLGHEMCHQWQDYFGKPGRRNYHNKEWAFKMQSIGLMPSSTGKENGKIIGQNMSDYIIEGGLFEISINKFLSQGKFIDWDYFSWETFQNQQIKEISEDQIVFENLDGVKEGSYITAGNTTLIVDEIVDDYTVKFNQIIVN
ncbi:MAG: SprT family zinc-dependent metalloprotease [Desulfobacterales bacterium]|nr:SprT family zinc-dependent metalloprotease [Desulfobacterales bacterium]